MKKKGKVRRAKLNFLRERTGRATRVEEKIGAMEKVKAAAAAEAAAEAAEEKKAEEKKPEPKAGKKEQPAAAPAAQEPSK